MHLFGRNKRLNIRFPFNKAEGSVGRLEIERLSLCFLHDNVLALLYFRKISCDRQLLETKQEKYTALQKKDMDSFLEKGK